MGYLHIDNLYKNQDILAFKECYALEKIHGTSAHVTWSPDTDGVMPIRMTFFSGGAKPAHFESLFNYEELSSKFVEFAHPDSVTTVFGEAYGGKQQGMRKTYGDELKFVVFDIRIGDCWLDLSSAVQLTCQLGLEFVAHEKVTTDLKILDFQRDLPSTQATRNGVEGEHIREGVVLRPLFEVCRNNGARVIAKHKRAEFRERVTIPEVDPAKREILEKADLIAEEWVTPMRLEHVLDKLGNPDTHERIPEVIKAMITDVCREADEFIVDSKAARKAIGRRACALYKTKIETV